MQGSRRRHRLYAAVERALAGFCDAIICVSRYERTEALSYGVPDAKLHVIYNGVPPADQIANKVESPYRTLEGGLNVLFVGRFDYQKGLDILVSAMERLKGEPFHLTAIGSGVLETIQVAPLLSNVTYTGWLSSKEIRPYLAHADVVVVPSRWEAFGLSAAEAMSYGRAVIAADVCSLPEMIFNGKTGLLFKVGDVSHLETLLRDTPREKWLVMGRAALSHWERYFTARGCQDATLDLYRKLIV